MNIGGINVQIDDNFVTWTGPMEVDADGAPNAYNPQDTGIDRLANAGHPGNYYGIVCIPEKTGTPVIQGPTDPFPGFFVAESALQNTTYPITDPRRYIDATKVPFISIPHDLMPYVRKGDIALVNRGQLVVCAVVADIGPAGKLGEGSIALHQGLNLNPYRAKPAHRLVGTDLPITFHIRRHSALAPAWPRALTWDPSWRM